jgi:hypothetical protein
MTDANNCYKILNIDIPPLLGSFDDIDPRKQWNIGAQNWSIDTESKISTTLLNPDLISFLSNNNIILANYFYVSNAQCQSHQSGPTYLGYTDGSSTNGDKLLKLATIEWNFSTNKVPHIFLDTTNSSNNQILNMDDTVWTNCANIITTVTPDNRPILFNCQAASVDNMTTEQKEMPLITLRQKKLSLVFIVTNSPILSNTVSEISFTRIAEKLKNYIVE